MARRPTNTKSRILETARTLYSTHGCDRTTIDDIITSSGITKGAFYHYFKSKESLCETLLEEVLADYQELAESLDSGIEPIEQLRQTVREIARLNASGEWVNCRLILRLSADTHEAHPKIQRRLREFWEWQSGFYQDVIQRCRDAGQLNSALDAKTQTRLLMAFMAGSITLERIAPQKPAFSEYAEVIVDLLGG